MAKSQTQECGRLSIIVVLQSGPPSIELDSSLLFSLLTDLLQQAFQLRLTKLAANLPTASHVDQQVLHHCCLLWLCNSDCVYFKNNFCISKHSCSAHIGVSFDNWSRQMLPRSKTCILKYWKFPTMWQATTCHITLRSLHFYQKIEFKKSEKG